MSPSEFQTFPRRSFGRFTCRCQNFVQGHWYRYQNCLYNINAFSWFCSRNILFSDNSNTVDCQHSQKVQLYCKMQFLLPECTASRCLIFKSWMSLSISLFSLSMSWFRISGLSFVVISAPSCRRFRALSPVGIYPNRASIIDIMCADIYYFIPCHRKYSKPVYRVAVVYSMQSRASHTICCMCDCVGMATFCMAWH